MASAHASLDAAAIDRKARLAKLASLKRKHSPTENDETIPSAETPSDLPTRDVQISKHLSGRNYDYGTRGPKLGFENAPTEGQDTLEDRAQTLTVVVREQEKEKEQEKPLDLFTLQPKKPNWDLKRDLIKKMELLDQRTDNAIKRMVKERVEGQKKEKRALNGNGHAKAVEGEELGIAGTDLVEGVKVREREEEEERREREEDSDTG